MPKRTLLLEFRSSACTLFLATSRPSTVTATVTRSVDEQIEFIFWFPFVFSFWLIGRSLLVSVFSRTPGVGDMLVCALFLRQILRWIRFGFTSRRWDGGAGLPPSVSD